MSVLKDLHHINFIVADLDAAVRGYTSMLGLGPFEYEDLSARGVLTARVQIGSAWIVLVSPQRENSDAGRYLKKHGEGFFLLSFGVDNVSDALAELSERGAVRDGCVARTGILDWQVADLDTEKALSARFHITQTG